MTTLAEQIGQNAARNEMSIKAGQFAALAKCIALARGDHSLARRIADDNKVYLGLKGIAAAAVSGRDRTPVYEMQPNQVERVKASVAAGATAAGDLGWGEQLAAYQVLQNAFLESLRNYGAFDAMLPSMRRVPFRTRIGAVTTGATGVTVGQQAPKPISRLTLSSGVIDEVKAVATLVITEELAKFGSAENLFATELANAVSVETDETFVSVLTTGVTAVPSTGVTAEGVRNDLRALLSNITTNARSKLFLLVPSIIARILSVIHTTSGDAAFPTMSYNGGSIGGITVVVSDGVPAATALLVDAQQVAAASETLALSASNEATLQLDTAPDSPPSGSTNVVSLWQYNMLGLRAERFFGATKLTSTGVATLSNINYTGDSPGP